MSGTAPTAPAHKQPVSMGGKPGARYYVQQPDQQQQPPGQAAQPVQVKSKGGLCSSKVLLACGLVLVVAAVAAAVAVVMTGAGQSLGNLPPASAVCSTLACPDDFTATAVAAATQCLRISCTVKDDTNVCCTFTGDSDDLRAVAVSTRLTGVNATTFATIQPYFVKAQAQELRVQKDQIRNVTVTAVPVAQARRRLAAGGASVSTSVLVTFDVHLPVQRVTVLSERIANDQEYTGDNVVATIVTLLVEDGVDTPLVEEGALVAAVVREVVVVPVSSDVGSGSGSGSGSDSGSGSGSGSDQGPTPPNNVTLTVVTPTVGGATRLQLAAGRVALQVSGKGQLFLLSRLNNNSSNSGGGLAVPAAQSYDGHAWEPAQPLLLGSIDCSGGGGVTVVGAGAGGACVIRLPGGSGSGHTTYAWQVSGSSGAATHDQRAARFLMTASFGATPEELAAFPSHHATFEADAEAWVDNQLVLPPTSHRAYYRRRANPLLGARVVTGGLWEPCDVNSRWSATADNATVIAASGGTLLGSLALVDLDPPVPGAKLLSTRLSPCNVSSADDVYGADAGTGQLYRYEKRLRLVTNTESSVARHTGGATACPTVAKNPFNGASCVIGASSCRNVVIKADVPLAVDAALLASVYTNTGHVVYAVTGLRLDQGSVPPPCEAEVSRWVRVDGGCAGATDHAFIEGEVQQAVAQWAASSAAASSGSATMPRVLDLRTVDAACTGLAVGVLVNANVSGTPTCWQHSHPDEYNVYDFTSWASRHPGNREARIAGRVHPILSPRTDEASSTLPFPSHHAMSRWDTFRPGFPLVGVWLGTVHFPDLPDALQTVQLAQALDVLESPVDDADVTGHEACGSPGEVANEPARGARFTMHHDGTSLANQGPDQKVVPTTSKQGVWVGVALSGEDQLRQRVAWVFAQLFVINMQAVPSSRQLQDLYVAFHDILVRNALGNFRDMLREVSYSAVMAHMLTFVNSKSLYYSSQYPDENYAREIMQLFTIGLWKMHLNGTRVTDDAGRPVPTYSQEDVLAYSRAWTGFTLAAPRSNLENFDGDAKVRNYVDPMRLLPTRRDLFPKLGLNGKYIGDGLPLCTELPKRAFLRAGARYRYIGTTHKLQLLTDPSGVATEGVRYRRLRLHNTSALYAELCTPAAATGLCQLRSRVELAQDISCTGAECRIDAPRAVEIVDARNVTFYYEYVRQPCVVLHFLRHGQPVMNHGSRWAKCIDPRLPAAQVPCCKWSSGKLRVEAVPFEFAGERTTFETGASRCPADMQLCTSDRFNSFSVSADLDADQGKLGDYWLAAPCSTKAQVFADGSISAVHTFQSSHLELWRHGGVVTDSQQVVRALWEGDTFPTVADGCGGIPTCAVHEQSCLCEVEEETVPVFTTAGAFAAADAATVATRLTIGSLPPAKLDGVYTQCSAAACGPQEGFAVFVDNGGNLVNNRTVVAVETVRGTRFLANLRSTVHIRNNSTAFAFRNPPSVMELWEPTARDAAYETEEVLDSYINHPNTAPHVAKTLISKLTVSNPTPAYVERVASAFRSGVHNGRGSGTYGDLAATVSAVLLDREALSVALEANPTRGAMRDPFLKVVHVLRSLSLRTRGGTELALRESTVEFIGTFPYKAPSIFNFYQPAYSPPGPLGANGLVSPESQLLTAPYIIGLLQGLLSLNVYGLSGCAGGFGYFREGASGTCYRQSRGRQHPSETWSGNLTYAGLDASTAASLIEGLDLYLTGGRMHAATKAAVLGAHRQLVEQDGLTATSAQRAVAQMVMSSAEFHQTGGHAPVEESTGAGAAAVPVSGAAGRPYRALVYLFLSGGTDSYNVLVPRGDCVGGEDLFAHYQAVRGVVALEPAELNDVQVPAGTQVCNRFGILKQLEHVTTLFNGGNASFVANVGALVEPIADRDDYKHGHKRRPQSLFAHNVQQKATQTTFAQSTTSTGVLGRINDALSQAGMRVGAYSLDGNSVALTGDGVSSPAYDVVSPSSGVVPFDRSDVMPEAVPHLQAMLSNRSTSLLADMWLKSASEGISRSASLSKIIDSSSLKTSFPAVQGDEVGQVAKQFHRTAQLIASRTVLRNDRDLFALNLGGFDTHNDAKEVLQTKAAEIDEALSSFTAEMQAQGLWENVTILVASEFGRTLTSNGEGTDHAWGGNAVLLGGGLRGGTVLGQYPRHMNESNLLNLGRGRLIPSTSWEAVWHPLAEWIGVESTDMGTVLPNAPNFGAQGMFASADVFENVH